MINQCVCPECLHPVCPRGSAEPPYDEVSHEINNNVISVKIPKNKGQFEFDGAKTEPDEIPVIDLNCPDVHGRKCRAGCTRVNVIPDQLPSTKEPDEAMFSLRSTRQIMPNDDLKNTLEIEFKAPRNYIPLPDPGPPPSVIVPRRRIKARKGKLRGKARN